MRLFAESIYQHICDPRVVTAQQLAEVAAEVNARPRKTLGWARPVDLFTCPTAVATA